MPIGIVSGQVAFCVNANYPNTTLTLPSNVTAGNKIVVSIHHSYVGCPPTISDSQGNTYAHPMNGGTVTGGANPGNKWHVWVATAGSTGANTITIAAACGSSIKGFSCEVSGALAGNAVDVLAGPTQNTASPATTGTATTTANGDLLLGFFEDEGGLNSTLTATSGETLVATSAHNDVIISQVQASAGAGSAITANWTGSLAAGQVNGVLVSLKAGGPTKLLQEAIGFRALGGLH